MQLTAALAALALVLAPTPGPTSTAVPGEVLCTVDDPRAVELSGLVATADGYVSVVDSQWDRDQVVVVYLDSACRVTRTQAYPTSPRDPEDLALAPDGALWVADIGDNMTASNRRETVALWRIPPGGGDPVIHRLTYPDGPHDAEALLFAADGTPVIVTKELAQAAYLYQATRPLEPNTAQGVPLVRVGEFRPTPTGEPGDLGRIGELLVTGAAVSPDRTRVALRTYTAAYEWDAPDGDIVEAITTREPRITPLPGEPQGEAIAYTVDGQSFLTVSDEAGPTTLRRYRPTAPEPTPGLAIGEATPGSWVGAALLAGGLAILIGSLVGLVVGRLRRR